MGPTLTPAVVFVTAPSKERRKLTWILLQCGAIEEHFPREKFGTGNYRVPCRRKLCPNSQNLAEFRLLGSSTA
jgi:hypothetical protein